MSAMLCKRTGNFKILLNRQTSGQVNSFDTVDICKFVNFVICKFIVFQQFFKKQLPNSNIQICWADCYDLFQSTGLKASVTEGRRHRICAFSAICSSQKMGSDRPISLT